MRAWCLSRRCLLRLVECRANVPDQQRPRVVSGQRAGPGLGPHTGAAHLQKRDQAAEPLAQLAFPCTAFSHTSSVPSGSLSGHPSLGNIAHTRGVRCEGTRAWPGELQSGGHRAGVGESCS